MEYRSQEWADRCAFQHSPVSYRRGAGENIYKYWSTGGLPSTEQLALDAGQAWWDELVEYGISSPNNVFAIEVFNQGVGHFTQMAWGRTTKVGCGVAKNCGAGGGQNVALVVCQYTEGYNSKHSFTSIKRLPFPESCFTASVK
ncbi:unnamed protein product [Toxocara canis]|uniref:SCP domain-containing protein n=1 Tax=Toxocara canis TaxID=6265 RepID=A0A3P7GF48_TOXCA|nr:unnamed protein product [Toxocara canis]